MRSECSRFTLYTRGGGGLLLPSLPSFFRSPFFLSFLSSCCRISGKRCRASVVHRHRSIVGITNWTERMKFAGCEIGQIFKEQLKRRFFFFFFPSFDTFVRGRVWILKMKRDVYIRIDHFLDYISTILNRSGKKF